MGSCISKCIGKRKHKEEEEEEEEPNHVQDKLVIISQAPISPPIPPLSSSTKQPSLSPSQSPISTSSISSLSFTTCNTSSSCSLSSSSSSIISSKESSFSNEFLWSCVKENPHVIHIDPIKGSLQKPQNLEKPTKQNVVTVKHVGSTPQKRARANSPILSRQKSFRREPERPNSPYSLPSRTLMSPSPSRRFSSGDNYMVGLRNSPKESCCKRSVVSKASAVSSGLSSVRKENLRPSSPNNHRNRPCLMNRETHTYRVGSKIDEIAVAEVLDSQDAGAIPMEDIDNPLIALDCFIFL